MADGQGRATLDGNRATFTRLAQQERRPADERRAREDAILLIGYRCGTKGLLVLAGLMRDPVEDGDQERVVTAISRSGSERAGEMLARLVSEPRDAELRDKALAAMANSADVVRGASPGLSTIAGLLDPGRPLDLKLGIAELARHVDLKAPAGAGGVRCYQAPA